MKIAKKQKENDVKKVIAELQKAGIDVTTGTIKVSNKPTINSSNGG